MEREGKYHAVALDVLNDTCSEWSILFIQSAFNLKYISISEAFLKDYLLSDDTQLQRS